MANVIDADEYGKFIAGLPAQLEPSLVANEAMSTAYFKARQRGWLADALISEGNRQLGSNGGVGSIVARFRMLATQTPVERAGEQRPERVPYVREDLAPIPFEWYQERSALLRRIGRGGFTADAAGNEMKALILRQKASRDADPFA